MKNSRFNSWSSSVYEPVAAKIQRGGIVRIEPDRLLSPAKTVRRLKPGKFLVLAAKLANPLARARINRLKKVIQGRQQRTLVKAGVFCYPKSKEENIMRKSPKII